jgi:16S rRNA (guanine966-N2)-methyltransferase
LVGGIGLSKKGQGKLDNRLRIIGGRWRGRKLAFPDIPGLRPTTDRVRETLFNWLQADIPGARCLDLFAGSGALGLEALSRGAARVVFVDESPVVTQQLQEHLQNLQCQDGVVINQSALDYLRRGSGIEHYDVIFLDPPFNLGLMKESIQLLEEKGWLRPNTFIYLETESSLKNLTLPNDWEVLREKVAGQVTYRLAVKR